MTVRITPTTKPAVDQRTVDRYDPHSCTFGGNGTVRIRWTKVHVGPDGTESHVGFAETTVDAPPGLDAVLRAMAEDSQGRGAVPAGTIDEE